MRGVDTNVLLRYLTADDPEQSPVARRLVMAAESSGDTLYINVIVLCELVWSLRGKRYNRSWEEIAIVIDQLLASPLFELQARDLVRAALRHLMAGSLTTEQAGFADYLLGEINQRAGCTDTATFDAALGDQAGFTLLSTQLPLAAEQIFTVNEP